MFDKLDKRQARALETLTNKRKTELSDFVRAMLSTSQGRTYFCWLIEISGMATNGFAANALFTAFNCGAQSIGQTILAHAKSVDLEGVLKSLEQMEKDQQNVNASLTDSRADTDTSSGAFAD